MWKNTALVFFGLLLAATLTYQQSSLNRLRSDLATAARLSGEEIPVSAEPAPASRDRGGSDASLRQRLAELERTVAQLAKASDYLMERGQLPLPTEKLDDVARKFAEAGTDLERLQALRLLRRNRAFTDETVALAVNWMQAITNSNLREEVLQQLGGLTNAVLRDPLLRLAITDTDSDVREQAVENLRRFVDDPEVEKQLWQAMQNDPEEDVREQAAEALVEGPKSEARLAGLRERASNPKSSVQERAVAWRALGDAGQRSPEVANSLAQAALTTQNPRERLALYDAFDDHNDPAFIPVLINGLQDPNPRLRERAANVLGDFQDNPNAHQWLQFIAENDTDPLVSREAFQRLGNR